MNFKYGKKLRGSFNAMRCMASLCMWHLANFQYISKVLNPHFLASINKPPDLSPSPFISPQPLHSPLKTFSCTHKALSFVPKSFPNSFIFLLKHWAKQSRIFHIKLHLIWWVPFLFSLQSFVLSILFMLELFWSF